MLEAVRNSIDGFQLFLAHQLLCHRTLPSKRQHRDARQEPASGQGSVQREELTRLNAAAQNVDNIDKIRGEGAEGFLAVTKRKPTTGPSDEVVRTLLNRYCCPVPFHVVRARFLGSIASPVATASPIEMVKGLWGGELPEIDSIDAVNELMGALVMGLWNRLTLHQERSKPFRLTRMDVPRTREGLATLTLMRREEVDGFVDGLFGTQERIEVPERAHRALGELGEIRAMLAGVCELASDPSKMSAEDDVSGLLHNISKLTKITEHEIHEAVLSCARARRQMSHALPVTKPVFH
jgi:hypothetical protein